MELYEVMRTTFACREFTGDPVPDAVLYRIIENARFAPSGGNRQGWRIINMTRPELQQQIADLSLPLATRYLLEMKQLTKLRRKPVEEILARDRWSALGDA